MSNTRLQKEHELNLLKRLSTDDAYRARFEQNPADALGELGVPAEQVAALDPASLKPGKLADKTQIAAAHSRLSDDNLKGTVCMVLPFLRVDYGDSSMPKPS